jgi:hypothetical protein
MTDCLRQKSVSWQKGNMLTSQYPTTRISREADAEQNQKQVS